MPRKRTERKWVPPPPTGPGLAESSKAEGSGHQATLSMMLLLYIMTAAPLVQAAQRPGLGSHHTTLAGPCGWAGAVADGDVDSEDAP